MFKVHISLHEQLMATLGSYMMIIVVKSKKKIGFDVLLWPRASSGYVTNTRPSLGELVT
jgi:hypothetical protein